MGGGSIQKIKGKCKGRKNREEEETKVEPRRGRLRGLKTLHSPELPDRKLGSGNRKKNREVS